MPMPSDWTDDRVALLKQLWGIGLSAAMIAARIGGGVTKNSVIGKAHRLNLCSHANAPPKQARLGPRIRTGRPTNAERKAHLALHAKAMTHTPRKAGARPAEAPPARPVVVLAPDPHRVALSGPVTLLRRTDLQCSWISGEVDGAHTLCCGAPKSFWRPWCQEHERIGYAPPKERQRRAA